MPFYTELDGQLQLRPEMMIDHPPQGAIPKQARVPYALTQNGTFLTAETTWIGSRHWVVRYRWHYAGREQTRLAIRPVTSGYGGLW